MPFVITLLKFECGKVRKMLKIKLLFLVCAVFGSAYATLGSDLEEDDFRRLKETENDDYILNEPEEVQNYLDEDTKTFYSGGFKICFDYIFYVL